MHMSNSGAIPAANNANYSPYGKWIRNLQNSPKLDTWIKDKYFKENNRRDEGEIKIVENEEIKLMKKKQKKIQQKYIEAQRINNMKLKEFMMKQRLKKEQLAKESQASSIKDQINAAIERSNQSKLWSSYRIREK